MTHATPIKPHEEPGTPPAMGATPSFRTDDKLVSSLFVEYENAHRKSKKKELATRIFRELSRHAQVVEKTIDPSAKRVLSVETSGVRS